ncbi:MAG: hypothetical protein OCD00_05210 [Colwellia sp.]
MSIKSMFNLVSIIAVSVFSSNIYAQDWNYQFEPYIMATNIEGDASIGRVSGVNLDIDFGTILDNLEGAALAHFEAHHQSGWGVSIDYGFMDLGGEVSNDNGSLTNVRVRQGVFEALGIYRTKLSNGSVDYFAGTRWWDNDIDVSVQVSALPGDGVEYNIKEDWVDLVVGVRWLHEINKQWTFQAQADIGGFGIGSEFTSSLATGLQYKISDLMTLNLKYKATWVDFDEGNSGEQGYFQYDTVTHGPIVGLIFNF